MRLNEQLIHAQLSALEGWQPGKDNDCIWRDFKFSDFHQTMAFVNAVAWIAHTHDHHPEMEIGFKHCLINYTTHSLGGLGEIDFICAQKINTLMIDC